MAAVASCSYASAAPPRWRGGRHAGPSSAASWACAPAARAVRRRSPFCVQATIGVGGLHGSDLGWPVDFAAHYVKGKLIGSGSFGTVYLGIDLHSGREVAIKTLPKARRARRRRRRLGGRSAQAGPATPKKTTCRVSTRLFHPSLSS